MGLGSRFLGVIPWSVFVGLAACRSEPPNAEDYLDTEGPVGTTGGPPGDVSSAGPAGTEGGTVSTGTEGDTVPVGTEGGTVSTGTEGGTMPIGTEGGTMPIGTEGGTMSTGTEGDTEPTTTGPIPSVCGDGMVEDDEQCDDMGESVSCNADCSVSDCGDGTTNATAGEQCDDMGESVSCDVDCSVSDCGDSLVNATAGEDCDDGGESADCDVDCTFSDCGDVIFNASAGEQCDEGGATASCDADCTLVGCGDGLLNIAAGEDCDDAGESAICNSNCSIAACGDGITNPTAGEACDDVGPSAGCDVDCTLVACGDGLLNPVAGEACDGLQLGGQSCVSIGMGFDGGTLACAANCTALDTSGCGTCGNGVIDGDEGCDGGNLGGESCQTQGFDDGELACSPDCGALVTSDCGVCGNGVIDGDDTCDGGALGGATCASLGLLGGTLGCGASCHYAFGSCDIPGVQFGTDGFYSGYVLTLPLTTCDDISATGTPTLLSDDTVIAVPMGFTFPVYGVDYTDVAIESNGALHWGDGTYLHFGDTCLPTAVDPSTNNLYVYWDDLNPGVGIGEVYYQTLGPVGSRRFVVQWDTAHYAGDPADFIRVQAMLHEDTGQIEVCYVDTLSAGNDNGIDASSGIQQSSAVGLQYSCSTPSLVNGLQLLYIPG
jgi:hypothetical protein